MQPTAAPHIPSFPVHHQFLRKSACHLPRTGAHRWASADTFTLGPSQPNHPSQFMVPRHLQHTELAGASNNIKQQSKQSDGEAWRPPECDVQTLSHNHHVTKRSTTGPTQLFPAVPFLAWRADISACSTMFPTLSCTIHSGSSR